VTCITQSEMVVLAGEINKHVRSDNVGYDETHGGYEYGAKNAHGSRILKSADGLHPVICNTLSMKQESKRVVYVAGPVRSTVDYIIVQQGDKAKVNNVKFIRNEECATKHKL